MTNHKEDRMRLEEEREVLFGGLCWMPKAMRKKRARKLTPHEIKIHSGEEFEYRDWNNEEFEKKRIRKERARCKKRLS